MIETESTHITPVGGNVFADLGFDAEEAAGLQAESRRRIAEAIARMRAAPRFFDAAEWAALLDPEAPDA